MSRVPRVSTMLRRLRLFLEMIRFSHTVFALPFAFASAALAWKSREQPFQLMEAVGILLCMVFARSAAMAFNRLADRRLDAGNPRTANRHLVTGQLSVGSTWLFTVACSMGFAASTSIFWFATGNPWPLLL